MLTYTPDIKPKRKDRPWLLFVLVIIWISGTAFFHSPWEPYEPFVVAVVKSILRDNSWLVPYISHIPYLDIQPCYFWIFAAILKLFHVNNIYSIAQSIRLINTLIIFSIVALSGRIGSNLSAYKNGRTVTLILISSIGFINNAYQLSPNILVLLGFCLYLYALTKYRELPGISGWMLFLGLLFISINFTCEFIVIGLAVLLILPLIDKSWRNRDYLITTLTSVFLFAIIFFLYCYQLQQVNNQFYIDWQLRYTTLYPAANYNLLTQFLKTCTLLSWYTLPGWFLFFWTCYKRRLKLFKDKTIQAASLIAFFLFILTITHANNVENEIFPIVLPIALIASLEVDSIRISIASLSNWFAICVFGIAGIGIWCLYFIFNFNYPQSIVKPLLSLSQGFSYHFNPWQLVLAIIITIIWIYMVFRWRLRGREVLTNWASGTTFVIVLFMSLCLPWFDSVLTFKPIVMNSLPYLDRDQCIVTNGTYSTQAALWYYYADINLVPGFFGINNSLCNQGIIATDNIEWLEQNNWQILWSGKRPVDKQTYYVVKFIAPQ